MNVPEKTILLLYTKIYNKIMYSPLSCKIQKTTISMNVQMLIQYENTIVKFSHISKKQQ